MSAETRERALDKLDEVHAEDRLPGEVARLLGARDRPRRPASATCARTSEFEFDRELGKIGKPIDRDEWFMTPQTVNAYYNPGFNEIVFPAAILQYPFFDADRDAAANYGAIGAVIGHEIGHGFDDQGSQFDGDGRLTDWWTDADRAAFEERTAGAHRPVRRARARAGCRSTTSTARSPSARTSATSAASASRGRRTCSRSTAREPPVIDGLTGASASSCRWAQAWQQKARDEEVIRLLTIDPHSPNEFRCNQIVRNIDAFYDAFGVHRGGRALARRRRSASPSGETLGPVRREPSRQRSSALRAERRDRERAMSTDRTRDT